MCILKTTPASLVHIFSFFLSVTLRNLLDSSSTCKQRAAGEPWKVYSTSLPLAMVDPIASLLSLVVFSIYKFSKVSVKTL